MGKTFTCFRLLLLLLPKLDLFWQEEEEGYPSSNLAANFFLVHRRRRRRQDKWSCERLNYGRKRRRGEYIGPKVFSGHFAVHSEESLCWLEQRTASRPNKHKFLYQQQILRCFKIMKNFDTCNRSKVFYRNVLAVPVVVVLIWQLKQRVQYQQQSGREGRRYSLSRAVRTEIGPEV